MKWLWLLWLWAGIPVIVQLQHATISRMNQPALIMEHRLSQAAIKRFPTSRWWTFWSFCLESLINNNVHILMLSFFLHWDSTATEWRWLIDALGCTKSFLLSKFVNSVLECFLDREVEVHWFLFKHRKRNKTLKKHTIECHRKHSHKKL